MNEGSLEVDSNSGSFEIEEYEGYVDVRDDSFLKQDVIMRYHRGEQDGYKLLTKVGDLNYIFRCSQSFGIYNLDFYTEEYKYALTNLSLEDMAVLLSRAQAFLDTLYQKAGISEVTITVAGEAYTAAQVESCIEMVMNHARNEYSEEELRSHFGSHEIFEYYREITGEEFPESIRNANAIHDRARIFRKAIERQLTGWKISDQDFEEFRFVLEKE